MTAIDRTGAIAAIRAYTDAYDAANPRIALKIEHTYHVAEACDAVAREQGDIYRLLDAPFGITQPFTDPATQAAWSRLREEMRDWLARA